MISLLSKYYKIDITLSDFKYTANKSKANSYHYSIPILNCACQKLKEIHVNFKKIYGDEYKFIKNKITQIEMYCDNEKHICYYLKKMFDEPKLIVQYVSNDF